MEVPAAVSRIYVYSPSLGAPTLTVYDVNGNPVQTQTASAKISAGTKSSSPYYKNWTKQSLRLLNPGEWNYDAAGKPSYLLAQGMDLTQKTLESIDATIPKGEQLNLLYSQLSAIHISEAAHVTLYNIFNKTSRSNALAYYVYPEDENNIPSQAEINENLILVYPNLSGNVLKAGDGVQLKYFDGTAWSDVFPANTNIGFVLLIDAWENGQLKTNNIHVMYSQKTYNRYGIENTSMADRPQMAAFKSGQDLILSFEDQPWSDSPALAAYKGDFSDNTFILHADPITALPDVPDGKEPGKLDEMKIETRGILAFEDIWPYQGDYDMNDVVIRYEMTDYFNTQEMGYNGLEGTFTFLHNGAQYRNGFGFQLETGRANAQATVISSYACQGQGIDPDLDKATVMLFDDGTKVPAGTEFKVKVIFNTPVPSFGTGYKSSPYNPFITIEKFTESERKEVHLINYAPTEKIDKSMLHYGKDLSVPEKGIYFVSDTSYPFAIPLSGVKDFVVPGETVRIDQVYPGFGKWSSSNGKENKDWYLHPQAAAN